MAKTTTKGNPSKRKISEWDRKLAKVCSHCPICKLARRKQKGVAFWFVRKSEIGLCPFCRAYERVYGRKSHQSIF